MDVTIDGFRYRESLRTSDRRAARKLEKDRIATIKAGEATLISVALELEELKQRLARLEKLFVRLTK
jgi:hypothetical protein